MPEFEQNALKPLLTEKFSGIIWKIATDQQQPIIAVETRDITNRTTAFSAFNYSSGKGLFKEMRVENSWHWNLDRVSNGMVLLHSYAHESNPQHKGIIALNKSGEIAWQLFNKALYEVTLGGIVVYDPNIQPRTFELLSAIDGCLISNKVEDFHPVERNIITPNLLDDNAVIEHLIPESIYGPVLYCLHNHHEIVAFHTQNGPAFNQQLKIFKDNCLRLEDNLELGIQKMNPEAFFIEGGQLFCIRNNKQELVSYLV